MIREERDPAFWERIVSHPVCAEQLMGIEPRFFAEEAVREPLLPLASEHGGFIFAPRDAFSRVVELHTMFTPEGWGREAARAGKQALDRVFAEHDMVVTYSREGDWRTRPPRSFGFRPAGEPFEAQGAHWRLWALTKEQWLSSPAHMRAA